MYNCLFVCFFGEAMTGTACVSGLSDCLLRFLYSLCHLAVIIVILCHTYCDFRSKILKKLHSEALTERTYENLNLLEKKLVGFIDSQFEERMRNHAHDIKSAIQMEISVSLCCGLLFARMCASAWGALPSHSTYTYAQACFGICLLGRELAWSP